MKKKYFYVSIVFIVLLILPLTLFYIVPFSGQSEISIEENRTLQKIPRFTFREFVSGEYQEKIELAIGDQMFGGIKIKNVVHQFYNGLTNLILKITSEKSQAEITSCVEIANDEIANIEVANTEVANIEVASHEVAQENFKNEKKIYTYKEVVAKKIYKLDDSGYLVEKPRDYTTMAFDIYDHAMLENLTHPKYFFFVETSRSEDLNDVDKYDAFGYIKNHFPKMDGYDSLNFKDFDEYKKLFYQTDHHWNYYGSYIGYKKIISMLEGDGVDFFIPKRKRTFDTIYNGSYARDGMLRCSTEKFSVYEFDLPEYKTYINDEEKQYGYRDLYVSDTECPKNIYSNHYGMWYGDEWAKVVFKTNRPELESILVLGTSFTNGVKELLSCHYNETHFLDFRYYRKTYGERYDIQKYMDKNNLSKVVIIAHIDSIGYEAKK